MAEAHVERRLNETREAQAARELGVTSVRPSVARALTFGFLALIASVAVVQITAEWMRGRRPQVLELVTQAPSEQGFRAFERRLDDSSVVGEALLPPVQSLLARLGAGNEQAYVGDGGTLLFRPGVDSITGPPFLDPATLRRRALAVASWEPPAAPDPRPAIADFARQLDSRGVRLVLLPVPVKPQFGADGRPDGQPIRRNPSFTAWRDAVGALPGVDLIDPAATLAGLEAPFLRTDTHWSPEAMDAVARVVAEQIGPRLVAPAGASVERGVRRVTNEGDVTTMLRLPKDQDLFPAETVEIRPLRDPLRRDGAEVLVLGDSFSNIYSLAGMGWGERAGFVEALSHWLARPVDRITINDAGASTTRLALRHDLLRGRDRLAGLRVVVWQFAERELAVGDWPRVQLPEAPSAADRTQEIVAHARGVVVQRAAPPRPGSVPYRDCLIAVRLRDVVLDGAPLPGTTEIVVYVFGMKDNRWTGPASWSPGRVVDLELIPWALGEEEFGSYNREELPDDDLFDAWWGRPH